MIEKNLNLFETYNDLETDGIGEIQRYTIAPVGVISTHEGKGLKVSDEVSEKIVKNIIGTPLYYNKEDDDNLPTTHGKENKIKIGKAIGGGTFTDEDGIKWVYGDFKIYKNKSNNPIMDLIHKNEKQVGCSSEMTPICDGNDIIDIESYVGTSILNRANAAWNTELMVASKIEENTKELDKPAVNILYDDILKNLVGDDYKNTLNKKDEEINKLIKDLSIKDGDNKTLKEKNVELLKLIKDMKKIL